MAMPVIERMKRVRALIDCPDALATCCAVSRAWWCVLVISSSSQKAAELRLTATRFSGSLPKRGTMRPLAFFSPEPLSATSRKPDLAPSRNWNVRKRLMPSGLVRPDASLSAGVPPSCW